ncbi:MAG TPA: pyruvate ferredoxin oxidoreductase [Prevotella sp.]
MDYKYIKQLLDRYWKCDTSLEEEEILRAFFSQKDVPADMEEYRDLFVFAVQQRKDDNVLGDDFDAKILGMIEEPAPVKARTISIAVRLRPLFKAAAMVAIILTLNNAMQASFGSDETAASTTPGYEQPRHGVSVALGDSAVTDSMRHSSIEPVQAAPAPFIK